jgi:hypothetical protein
MMADKRKDMTAVALQRVRELGWEELRKEEAMMFPDRKAIVAKAQEMQTYGETFKRTPWGGDGDCEDCFVARGQLHIPGCDMEPCPKCGGQVITCGCFPESRGLYAGIVKGKGR